MKPQSYFKSDPTVKQLIQKYNGALMEDTQLMPSDADAIWEYLKSAGAGPTIPEAPKPLPEDSLARKLVLPDEGFSVSWPGVASMLLLLAFAGALWRVGLVQPAGVILIFAVGAGYWAFGGRHYYHILGNQQGYQPAQPIAFSHATHAGRLGISCLYCHYGAEKSDVAGIPAVNVCMNCHGAVHKSSGEMNDSPEIAKLLAVWDNRLEAGARSIEWIRVHNLPAYVHFSHRVHVNNNIQCLECHGPVPAMIHMRQASSLSMGWCIACHRLNLGTAPTHWMRAGGPLDCAACHQ
jgi:hypothetical protein